MTADFLLYIRFSIFGQIPLYLLIISLFFLVVFKNMKILIAPDSFKGSLSAIEFCRIVAEQIQCFQPDTELQLMPLADGGEGTIDAILANARGQLISTQVQDPLGNLISAQYAILDEHHTAVIEMARASGLAQIESALLNPLLASSFGTGELILDALEQGCRRFIIGLGGSATNDGGTGMLQALGVRFLDVRKQVLRGCGANLKNISTIDLSDFDPRMKASEVIIAGDVTNPLLGDLGATYIYGPQKGADEAMLVELEEGMTLFAKKSAQFLLLDDLFDVPGTGAAGGMGYALMAYCQASMQSGFELIADMTGLDGIFAATQSRPDLIITGEGRFDSQSLNGKLIGRLSERTDRYDIPLIVICGAIGDDLDREIISRNVSVFSLVDGPCSLEYAMRNSPMLLEKLMMNMVRLLRVY